jgi:exosortase
MTPAPVLPAASRRWFSPDVAATHADTVKELIVRHWALALGAAAMVIPTIMMVAQVSWSTEQGAHGPVVLATGLWLIGRMWHGVKWFTRRGSLWVTLPLLLGTLAIYVLGRVSGTPEIEGYALYFTMVVVAYAYCGVPVIRRIWFPILYLFFVFPPPDSVVAAVTQPLKLGVSAAAVWLLDLFGLPIGRTGVIITVDQYDILVAAACAGLNSVISLSAIGLFYIYIRHNANYRYAMLLVLAIVPIAIFANFIRVLLLILITYYFGDPVAQGFLHGFAGMTMFAIALLGIFALDRIASPLRHKLAKKFQG